MRIAPFRAFLLSFVAGLMLLIGAHGAITRLTHHAPEMPRGPLPVPTA